MAKLVNSLESGVPFATDRFLCRYVPVYRQAQIDTGVTKGVTSDEKERTRQLELENAELRRANEILRAASIFFATELDGPSTRQRK